MKRRLSKFLYWLDDVIWPPGPDSDLVAKWRQSLALWCCNVALYSLGYFRDGEKAPAWCIRR